MTNALMTVALQNDRAWALFYRDHKTVGEIATELGCTPEDLNGLPKTLDDACSLIAKQAMSGMSKLGYRLAQMGEIIDAREHEIEEQEKVLANMADALDKLTDRKKAQADKTKLLLQRRIKFGRNASYLDSVKLGLKEAIWLAPTTMIMAFGPPLKLLLIGIGTTIGSILFWPLSRVIVLVAGLLGFVCPPPKTAE